MKNPITKIRDYLIAYIGTFYNVIIQNIFKSRSMLFKHSDYFS